MKKWILILSLATSCFAHAESSTFKFNFENGDIKDVVAKYANETNQKFMIDPAVHGKITILNSGALTADQAFNELSKALALNGLGIVKQNDVFVISTARSIQRSNIEVVNQVPPLEPEKMYQLVLKLKYISADEVNRQLRNLSSKDGELVPFKDTNTLIITDWSSNLQRIGKTIEMLDVEQPATDKKVAKSATDKKSAPRFKSSN